MQEQPALFDDNLQPRFNGSCYDPEFDQDRLTGQIRRVYVLMIDGQWRTLDEIHASTGDPPASISAQLRNLRKERFGSHIVDKRRRGDLQGDQSVCRSGVRQKAAVGLIIKIRGSWW